MKYRNFVYIGNGSFGTVYKALDENNTEVAIKIFNEDYVSAEFQKNDRKNRVFSEIDAYRRLPSHKNIIKYIDDYEFEENGVKKYAIVMDYIEGQNLLEYSRGKKEEEIIEVFLQILDGLGALHENDIIHRDLKPENIIVKKDGTPVILDYGLSKMINYTTITKTGEWVGSPVYLSPEQLIDSKRVTLLTDIYSLGVVLYYILTSHFPYEFQSREELFFKILKENPIPPRRWDIRISNFLEDIVLKCLQKEPYKRFHSTDEMKRDFAHSPVEKISRENVQRIFLHLYNEASALEKYFNYNNNSILKNCVYPANHRDRQKSLLNTIKTNECEIIIDPASARLSYSNFVKTKGLVALPYSPIDEVITPSNYRDLDKIKNYVKECLKLQVDLGATIFMAPYHHIDNSTTKATPSLNPVKEWFDFNIKLIKESIDYKNQNYPDYPIYASISLNLDNLLDKEYRETILNVFSTINGCDGYIIYTDGIKEEINSMQIYNYCLTLKELQDNSNKAVIAGRISPFIGFALLSLNISGFTMGVTRFESFYEDLFTNEDHGYNLYERYYVPQLLRNIAIERKTPLKLMKLNSIFGNCSCHFCNGKSYAEIVKLKDITKLHFLIKIDEEFTKLKSYKDNEKLPEFLNRLDEIENNYKKAQGIFKTDEYKYISDWRIALKKFI